MALPPADSRVDGSPQLTLRFIGRSARLCLTEERLGPGLTLERAELELADLGPSADLNGGPEQFRDRATSLERIAVRVDWSAVERALTTLGPVELHPDPPGVGFELRYGRGGTPVAAPVMLGPGGSSELEVVFAPARVFGVPDGPTVRLAERVRQALVRATGGAAPAVARSFRSSGPTAFAFDGVRAALWPTLPRRGLKMPSIPEDFGFELELDGSGLRLAGHRGGPRTMPRGFSEAQVMQVDLHQGRDAELLLARGRWVEAYDVLADLLARDEGPRPLLERTVELGLGVGELRGRTFNLIEAELPKRAEWTFGRLARAVALRAEGDDVAARRAFEAVGDELRALEPRAAGLAYAAAARGADPDDRARLLESGVALRPDDPEILTDLVEALATVQRPSAAVRAARRLARVARSDEGRRRALRVCARLSSQSLGDHAAAREALDEVLATDPEDLEALAARAANAAARGDFDDAVRRYLALGRRAESASDPRAAARWYAELASALEANDDPDGALETLDHARRLDPRDLRLTARLLARARRLGRLEWGRARFDREAVPQRGPAAAAVLREAAGLWAEAHPARSAELLNAARRADPDDPDVLEALLALPAEAGVDAPRVAAELAQVRLDAGDLDGLLAALRHPPSEATAPSIDRILERAVARWPARAEVWQAKLAAAEGRGDAAAAWAAATELTHRVPAGPERGRAHLAQGRWLEASGQAELAERAYAAAEGSPEIRAEAADRRARLCLADGRPSEARAVIDAVMDGSTPEDLARRLMERRAAAGLAEGDPRGAHSDLRAALAGGGGPHDGVAAAEIALAAGAPDDAARWAAAHAAREDVGAPSRAHALQLRLRALDALADPTDRVPILRELLGHLDAASAEAGRFRQRLRSRLEEAGRPDDVAALDRAAAELPGVSPTDRAARWLAAAEVAFGRGQDAEAAARDVERALRVPGAVDRDVVRRAARLGVEVAEARGDPEAAARLRARLTALEPPEAKERARLEQARALADDGRHDDAVALLEVAAAEAKGPAPAAQLAALHAARDRIEDAARWFDQAARRAERAGHVADAARFHGEAAGAYARAGDGARADHHDRAVLALAPRDATEPRAALERLLARARDRDDHAEVVELLARAAPLAPDPSPLWLELGLVRSLALDQPEAARAAWSDAWRHGEAGPAIAGELSALLGSHGRAEERLALEVARAHHASDPASAAAGRLRAARIAFEALGDRDAALEHVAAALELDPVRADAPRLRIRLLRASADPEEVAASFALEAQAVDGSGEAARLWLEAARIVGEAAEAEAAPPGDARFARAHAHARSAARADPARADAAVAEARWARRAGVDPAAALDAAARRAASPEARWAAAWARTATAPEDHGGIEALAELVDARRGLDDGRTRAAMEALGHDGAEGDWTGVLDRALECTVEAAAWARHVDWLAERADATDDPGLAARMHRRRAQVLEGSLERPDEALEAIRQAAERSPDDVEIAEELEDRLAAHARWEELVGHFGKEALRARWEAWRAAGDPRARPAAEALSALDPVGSPARADVLEFLAEGTDSAADAALHHLADEGDDATRHRALAELEVRYAARGDAAARLDVLRRRAELEPDDPGRADVSTRIATLLDEAFDDPEGAEREYRAALALDPSWAPARQGLAALWGRQDRFEAVVEELGPDALAAVRDGLLAAGEAERAFAATDVLVPTGAADAASAWMAFARALAETSPEATRARPAAWARAARAGSEEAVGALWSAFRAAPEASVERVRLAELLAATASSEQRPELLLAQARGAPPETAVELTRAAFEADPTSPAARDAHTAQLRALGRWAELAEVAGPEALDDVLETARAGEAPELEPLLRARAEAEPDPRRAAPFWLEIAARAEARGEPAEAWVAFLRGTGPEPAGVGDRERALLRRLARHDVLPPAIPRAVASRWIAALEPAAEAEREALALGVLTGHGADGPAELTALAGGDPGRAARLAEAVDRARTRLDGPSRVRAAVARVALRPDRAAVEGLDDALSEAAGLGAGVVAEVRPAWLSHRVRGDAATRLAAVRRLIAAADAIADPELLALEVAATLDLDDWDGAEYAVDALLDDDLAPVEFRRRVAEGVVAAAERGAPDRLVERAWLELARPETARDDRARLTALFALADLAEARGAPAGDVVRPLEASLGLDVPEEEHLRTRRRLFAAFERAGDWRQAERHQAVIAPRSGSAGDSLTLAELRLWLDDPDGARAAVRAALAVDPGCTAAHELRIRLAEGEPAADRAAALAAKAESARDLAPDARARAWLAAVRATEGLDRGRALAMAQRAMFELPEAEALDPFWAGLADPRAPVLDAADRDDLLAGLLARWGPRAPGAVRRELAARRAAQGRSGEALDVLEEGFHPGLAAEDPLVDAWRTAVASRPEAEQRERAHRAAERAQPGALARALAPEPAAPERAGALDAEHLEVLRAADADARAGRLNRALDRLAAWDGPEATGRRMEWLRRCGRDDEAEALLRAAETRFPWSRVSTWWLEAVRWQARRNPDPAAAVREVEARLPELSAEVAAEALMFLIDLGASEAALRLARARQAVRSTESVAGAAASAAFRRGDVETAVELLRPHAGLRPELARVFAAADDPEGLLDVIESTSDEDDLASRLDRAWTAVHLRMDRLGRPCADQLHAVRTAVEAVDDEALVGQIPLLCDLAARAERLGRPDDARALRERLAPFDSESREALLSAWVGAGRYEAVVEYFERHPPATPPDLEAFVRATSALGRDEAALAGAKALVANPPAVEDAETRSRRLALAARVALDAREVVLGLDWGRLASWLRPGAFDPARYAAAIESGPPTPEKIALSWARLARNDAPHAVLDELRRCLDALPDAPGRAALEAERVLLEPEIDVAETVRKLNDAGAVDAIDRVLRRVSGDEGRDPKTRSDALRTRLERARDASEVQEVLRISQAALRTEPSSEALLDVALDAARRAEVPEVELELLRRHGRGPGAATRAAVLLVERAPLDAARTLSRAMDAASPERRRTIAAHLVACARRVGRPDAEADVWARVAAASEGPARASAFSRVAIVRAEKMDDRRGARAAWRAAVQASPEDLELRRGLLEATEALGELRPARQEAEEAARWAVRQGRDEAAVAFSLQAADLAARAEALDAELALWRHVLDVAPDSAVVLESLVARGRRLGGTRHLDVLLEAIERREAGFARGRMRIAAARLLEQPLGRTDEAERLRARASETDLAGETRETTADLLAAPPPPAWETADLGVSRSELRLSGRFDHWAALEAARAEGTPDPINQARLWLAVARIHRNRPEPDRDQVQRALRRAVGHHPLHAPALRELLRFEVGEGLDVEARRTLERLDRIGGPGWASGELERMAGALYRRLGEPDDAKRWFERAQARDPDALAPLRAQAELESPRPALDALRVRLDPHLDRDELARVELAAARENLSERSVAEAARCVDRALAHAPHLDGAWTLRRRIAEAADDDEALREALAMEALHTDDAEAARAAVERLESAGDVERLERLLSAWAEGTPPATVRARVIAHLRARGRPEDALGLLEKEGGFAAAPEPTAAELAAWIHAFDARGRWADVFRVLAHARHLGLDDAVLAGLAPFTEEAESRADAWIWLAERRHRLDPHERTDPRVGAGCEISDRRDSARSDPAPAIPVDESVFELSALDARAEASTGEARAGALAVRRFLATGDARLELAGPPELASLAAAFAEAPVEARAADLGWSTPDDVVEGAPGPLPGVWIRPVAASGFGIAFDPEAGEVRLGRAWFDHARDDERRFVAIRAIVASVVGSDASVAALDAAALWVARDLGAAFRALRRPTWRALVEPQDDPKARTEVLRRDARLTDLFARCAGGALLVGPEAADLLASRAFGTSQGR